MGVKGQLWEVALSGCGLRGRTLAVKPAEEVFSLAKPSFWSVIKTLNGKFHCYSNNDHDRVLARDAGRPLIQGNHLTGPSLRQLVWNHPSYFP